MTCTHAEIELDRYIVIVECDEITVVQVDGATASVAPPPATADQHFDHIQLVAATTWTINHNFGWRPTVNLFSVGGVSIEGEIVHVSVNQVQVLFDNPSAGFAVLS